MTLYTASMSAPPSTNDGLRICIMRDPRIYNRHQKKFQQKHGRAMYDKHLKALAPSEELKNAYKSGGLRWEDYEPRFQEEVLERASETLRALAKVAMLTDITLLCSEKTPDRCHRRLVAEECARLVPDLEVIVR